jgi:hypothetical protein
MQLELGFASPQRGDDSDEALSTLGYVTITPLASVSEDVRPDVREAVGQSIASAGAALGVTDQAAPGEADGAA